MIRRFTLPRARLGRRHLVLRKCLHCQTLNSRFSSSVWAVPRPFAGYTNSDFAYIGLGVSQQFPYPGKLKLRGAVADRDADTAKAHVEVVLQDEIETLKTTYFHLAYLQQTLRNPSAEYCLAPANRTASRRALLDWSRESAGRAKGAA